LEQNQAQKAKQLSKKYLDIFFLYLDQLAQLQLDCLNV